MCELHHPDEDMAVLSRAYERAVVQHREQRRKSGEPYIIHPLAVSQILADLGMGPTVVAAGLLHDTVEDTDYTLEECRDEFGETIAGLVDGVTKLSKMEYGDSAQAETIRKMVVAMSRDVRVLVVKLADRVHNARTWRYVKASSAQRKARETLDVYAPLANRLGMNAIKTELEELSFKVLYPKIYNEIVVLVARRAGQRDVYLKQILAEINDDLTSQGIEAFVSGRPKDYFSIYQKMIVRGHDFANIYDLVGVRVVVDSIQDCYAALGAVHARWNPVPGRFKDYIAMPKLNMYQSLHTTVVGPGGKPVEIQIRTWDMHRRAEFGIAAHWKYKENGKAGQRAVRS
jgi:GTP pyrophosphokinase